MVSPRKSRRKSACFSSTVTRDAGARQQKAQHHARRPAAGDAARGFDRGSLMGVPRTGRYAQNLVITTRGDQDPSPMAKAYACFSGVRTTSPSSSSVTLIWQDSREFGRTS